MITFVILNYYSCNDTIKCINSINAIKTKQQQKIIVVDNNSMTSKEIEKIKVLTKDLLILDQNYGYAKANNIGAKYAQEKYHPDFICISNSDIVINQTDFIDKIYELYKKYQFDILGPKIETDNGSSVNPFPAYKTIDEVRNRIKYYQKLIKIYDSRTLPSLLKIYSNMKLIVKKPIKLINGICNELSVPLHGCFMIFSKKYYEKFANIIPEYTFLFHEEEFIYYRIQKNSCTTLYSPNIQVFHGEEKSIKQQHKNDRKKKKFKVEESLKSLKKLEELMEQNINI